MSEPNVRPVPSRRFTPGRILAFILIVAGVFIYDGNRKQPEPANSGASFNGQPATSQPTAVLRVATFNMAGGVGGEDNHLNLNRTAAAITGYDLVGLQEVHGRTLLNGKDEAEILGDSLKLPWLFAPVESRWWHPDFGNGAVTDLSVLHWETIPISSAISDTNRNMLLFRVKFQNAPVNVIVTHLDRHADHDAELKIVLNLFESLEKPAIVLADLNTEPTYVQREKLIKMSNEIGIPFTEKTAGLDWILTRGMHATNWGETDNGASDHKLVWADLVLDPQK